MVATAPLVCPISFIPTEMDPKNCDKEFKTNSGLWKHNKICKISDFVDFHYYLLKNVELLKRVYNNFFYYKSHKLT